MLVKSHQDNLKLFFNYNQELVDKLNTIPRAKFNPDAIKVYWTIPVSSLSHARKAMILSEGSLYPDAKNHIKKEIFQELDIEIKEDKLKASGPNRSLAIFNKSIHDLCSYEEKENDIFIQKTLAKTIYYKNQITVISFPIGLYAKVAGFCRYINPKSYLVLKQNTRPAIQNSYQLHNFEPRPYQQTVAHKIKNELLPNRATLVMATGAGKTKLAALITAKLNVPTIFYVYSDTLLRQTAKTFEDILKQDVGRIGGNRFTIKPLTVASMQTVYSCYERQDQRWDKLKDHLNEVELMFVDEGHMLGANTIYTVANLTNAYYSYALTATPFREDGKEIFIEAATGPAIELITEEELINGGYILPVEVEIHPVKHDPPRRNIRYRNLYENEIIDHWDRHRAVVKAAKKYTDKQVIILVKEIRHGQKLQDNLLCPFIHGRTKASEREEVLERFKAKEINALIASSILKQGVDIPEAEVLILAHGGASMVELLQKIGRVRRPAENKTKGIVIDFYDHIHPASNNDVLKKQAQRRLALYEHKKFIVKGPLF